MAPAPYGGKAGRNGRTRPGWWLRFLSREGRSGFADPPSAPTDSGSGQGLGISGALEASKFPTDRNAHPETDKIVRGMRSPFTPTCSAMFHSSRRSHPAWFLLLLIVLGGPTLDAAIRLTEIHYRPVGTNVLEEWLEVHNSGSSPTHIGGWRLSGGVRFEFPTNTVLSAGGRLVVAADPSTFRRLHPAVEPVVGGWTGTLDDDGEKVSVDDANGATVASVDYAPEGDWAVRRLAAPDSHGKIGWEWHALHDGRGHTLELVSEGLPQGHPLNWASSSEAGGTPGAVNSTGSADAAPLVGEVVHRPAVPRPSDVVSVAARIVDDGAGPVSVQLHHRIDGAARFLADPMFDDGAHGDGLAGDGLFGARLPAEPDGTVVEYFLTATDTSGHTRTYPAVVPSGNARTANLLYQVSSEEVVGAQPFYRIVMAAAEYAALRDVWSTKPNSDAESSGTWIATDAVVSGGTTTQVRQLASFRNRGHGTRISVPHNIRVNLPKDRPWQERFGINLNTQYTLSQVLGSRIFRMGRVPMSESRAVRVRVNGSDLAGGGQPQFGSYAANELVNVPFLRRQFPGNAGGNLYRAIRDAAPGAPRPELNWLGGDFARYTNSYFKQNNTDLDDWTDLVRLLDTLSNAPEAEYVQRVRAVADVDEWMRYLALNTLLDNQETCIGTGNGDDFALYRGSSDPRFQLLSYDMDSILGAGTRAATYADGLFRMFGPADRRIASLERLLKHPEFAPAYYRELLELADHLFDPARLDELVDGVRAEFPAGPAADTAAANIKAFNASHLAYVRSLVPVRLAVSNSLPVVSGLPRSTGSRTALSGVAHAARTRRVLVNGLEAAWSAWEGRWTLSSLELNPGVNRVVVQAIDGDGAEFDRAESDIWYDDASVATAPATLSGTVTWTAAGGPWNVASGLVVEAGATLVVEAGASVYLGAGADITIASGGRVLLEGTPEAPVRLARAPGSTSPWGGITLNGGVGSPESRFVHVRLEGNGSTAIHSSGGTLFLDHVVFATPDHQYVSLDDSSFVVRHCVFPTASSGFELTHGTGGIKAGGRGVFLRNFFGRAQGYNDVLDFTGGTRPGPVLEVVDNVFMGSGDDVLDLDGTDAWVEGNLFLHVHRNGSPDTSSAVSGGNDSGRTSRITVVGNVFFDVDQAMTAKQGNFYVLLHNTVVHQTHTGSQDPFTAVVNVGEEGVAPGAGSFLAGNLFADAEALLRNHDPARSRVVLTNNLMPFEWIGPGGGNVRAPAVLNRIPTVAETDFRSWQEAQVLRGWLRPAPGSPARGTAGDGLDYGAPAAGPGIVLAGAPQGDTADRTAFIRPGFHQSGPDIPSVAWPEGAGFVSYRWRLDGGPWSGPVPAGEPIRLVDLADGPHRLEVLGRRDTGSEQDDPRFGALAVPTAATWTVDPEAVRIAVGPVVINELLARNETTFTSVETTPDLVELHNMGTNAVDLSGTGLSDDPGHPHRFRFPEGARIGPGEHLVLIADSDTNSPGVHLGFSLRQEGETLVLSDREDRGGGILDAVSFGLQVPDRSLGRRSDGTWGLCEPTFGSANRPAELGDRSRLRINEWLANARFVLGDDFVELHNADPRPVALGGLWLSDAPGQPRRHPIPDLSFIPAGGVVAFVADGDGDRAGHLGFRLASESGTLELSEADGSSIDIVAYGPQATDRSEGRSPNGSGRPVFFGSPTPGALNPGGTAGSSNTVTHVSRTLIGFRSSWRYSATGATPAADWNAADYDDSAWNQGEGLLGVETSSPFPYPFPIGTALPLTVGGTRIRTYYFRTRFDAGTDLAGLRLVATNLLDDGAVLHLNGRRVAALRVADDPAGYASDASIQSDEGRPEVLEFPSDALRPGTNVLAVEVHQSGSSSTDVVFGLALAAVQSFTNTVVGDDMPVVLNEVLVRNRSRTNAFGATTAFVEVRNTSERTLTVEGLGIGDDPTRAHRWTFPAGTTLPPHGFLAVSLDPLHPASATNAPFVPGTTGGALYLSDAVARGGGILDVVRFGLQVPDFAVGRVPDGSGAWTLTLPTEGTANLPASTGTPEALRLNEWMADPVSGSDWLELHNADSAPVALGGLSLTDDLGNPSKSVLPPLSFIGSGADGFVQLFADNRPANGADHLSFRLGRTGSPMGLFAASGLQLDALAFGPQGSGVSEGRLPDGAPTLAVFPSSSTPGAANRVFQGEADNDGDGMPDAWEILHGLDPRVADAAADTDRDGLDNLSEYRAGTDPADARSGLSLRASVLPDGVTEIGFPAVAGHSYTVQYRDSLGEGAWQPLASFPPTPGSGALRTTDRSVADPARYYRVVSPAVP